MIERCRPRVQRHRPQFPETSLADDVARLRHVLTRQSGPTVVAGHSYGGQVMTALGDRRAERGRARLHRGVRARRGRVDRRAARAGRADTGPRALEIDSWASHGCRGRLRQPFAGDIDPVKAGSCRRTAASSHVDARGRDGRPRLEVVAFVVSGRRPATKRFRPTLSGNSPSEWGRPRSRSTGPCRDDLPPG